MLARYSRFTCLCLPFTCQVNNGTNRDAPSNRTTLSTAVAAMAKFSMVSAGPCIISDSFGESDGDQQSLHAVREVMESRSWRNMLLCLHWLGSLLWPPPCPPGVLPRQPGFPQLLRPHHWQGHRQHRVNAGQRVGRWCEQISPGLAACSKQCQAQGMGKDAQVSAVCPVCWRVQSALWHPPS